MSAKKRSRVSSTEQAREIGTQDDFPRFPEGEEPAWLAGYCQFCRHTYRNKEVLEQHLSKKHKKDTPYNCLACSASFARRDLLSHHEDLAHYGPAARDRNFNSALAEISSRKVRQDGESPQAASHPEDEERAFRCQFCVKAFNRKEHLQRHERLHTKEKPFHCTICSDGFARSDLLTRHYRMTHLGDIIPHSNAEAELIGDEHSSLVGIPPERLHEGPSSTFTEQGQNPWSGSNSLLPDSTPLENASVPLSGPVAQINSVAFVPQIWALNVQSVEQDNGFGDFDLFIDSLNGTYDSGMSSFYADQPILPSPSAPLFPAPRSPSQLQNVATSTPHLFDEFSSTFPSFEPSPPSKAITEPWKIAQHDWDYLSSEIRKFASSLLPPGFWLPSRHTMTRYISTYFAGFHRHLPFMHLPTFSCVACPIELVLAMASIGAISAFDQENAVMLFRAAFSIAQENLRDRKERRRDLIFCANTVTSRPLQSMRPLAGGLSPAGNQQSEVVTPNEQRDRNDPLPLAQTLLILMAMATWGNSEAIFDEAVTIQNILVNYVRSEKLLDPLPSQGTTWSVWIQEEGFKRTVAIIFCFLIFHTIVYDLPPPILNPELNIHLPSREKDWEARSEEEWKEARSEHEPETHFQQSFFSLFSSRTDNIPEYCSSLGGYTLILALIQHIHLLRAAARTKPEGEQELSPRVMDDMERALSNWQKGWNQDLESFLGPASPLGPISFNATALLRMAYIRLNVDLGPWRALTTHDPYEVAISIHRSPKLKPNRRLTRAVLYSAHALSIPVKIGVNIVTHNLAFSWSLQHSLCALECAFVISKWLAAIRPRILEGTADEEEARVHSYILDMVKEAEGGRNLIFDTDLPTRVVRIWARLLSGKAHWNVVPMIGNILEAYAQILENHTIPNDPK